LLPPRALRYDSALPLAGGGEDRRGPDVMRCRQLVAILAGAALAAARARADPALQPCSHRTALTISEIMYHPPADTAALEFVELCNTDPVAIDLGGYRLTGDIAYTFPTATVLAARSFLVVAADPAALQHAAGLTNVLGPFSGALPNDAGTVRLANRWGAELLAVEYADADEWPAAADGAGHSLVLAQPAFGAGDPRAWAASAFVGGSPGRTEPPPPNAYAGVCLNEILAHTDPDLDRIELYHAGTQALDLSGCALTDDPPRPGYLLPPGTVIAPRRFLTWDETQLGFRLSMSGETVLLFTPARDRVIDAVRFGAQARGAALGRFPDGAPDWRELSQPTLGQSNTNAALRIRVVLINEIMFHPLSGRDEDEYIELHNRGSNAVDLSYWRFTAGVSFMFPPGTTIPAGGYLVVAADADRLRRHYPQLNAANTLGNYSGRLSDRGERLALAQPDDPARPYQDFVVVDEVAYRDGWAEWTDGGGSSLELSDPRADHRRAANWAGSDETRKAPWTAIACTGVLDNGSGALDELNVFLLQAGECLVDNIDIVKLGETVNRVAPADFEADLNGWTCSGNHVRSGRESAEGYGGGASLRVRASAAGRTTTSTYPLGNYDRIWKTVSPPPAAGETFAIRAQARWLRGWPFLALALKGFWLEAAGALAVPSDLGTPGLPNSRRAANAPPAVWDLTHEPLLPPAGAPVRVLCRVHDPDGIAALRLEYRLDPSNVYATVPMSLPAVGGNGRWSAVIPPLPAGQLVAFRVVAVDGATPPATNVCPSADPRREALVRFGETHTNAVFGRYTVWVSDANVRELASRPMQSNEPVDCTFIGHDARGIYNATLRYRGNFRRFTNITDAAYAIDLPKAERFLDDNSLKLDIPSLQFPNGTYQQERHAYWLAREIGHPASHLRFVRVHVNGSDLLRHDLQLPTRDFARSWHGDEDPWIHKEEKPLDPFQNYVSTGGVKKRATYRFIMEKYATTVPDDDYSALYRLVDALNQTNPPAYLARVAALADIARWAGYFAVNHAAGNVDSYGFGESFLHNLYAYLPPRGRSALHLHDLDSAFASNDPRLFPDAAYPVVARLFRAPPFERVYWRLLQELAAGPMAPDPGHAVLDAWHAALAADGLAPRTPDDVDPNTGKSMRQWIAERRAQIQQQLAATNAAAFLVTTAGGADFATDQRLVLFQGLAPVAVDRVLLNGRPLRLDFDTPTAWRARIGLQPGSNRLEFVALDRFGARQGEHTLTALCTAPAVSPEGWVVFNEILYHPPAGGVEFLELHNRSAEQAFDLGGWRVAGLDFAFDAGTVLEPGAYAVLTESRPAFAAVFGNAEDVCGEYAGRLDNAGERLRLLRPDGSNGWALVDEACFAPTPPWPADAAGQGSSLQRLDASRPGCRIGNWAAVDLDANAGWRFVSVTGRSSSNPRGVTNAEVRFWLPEAGTVLLDRVALVAGAAPEVGSNLLANGDFETALSGPWLALGNHAGSATTSQTAYSGARALALNASSPGAAPSNCLRQAPLILATNTLYTLSYWYYAARAAPDLAVALAQSDLALRHGTTPPPPSLPSATPAAANALAAALPPFPPLWINELMPSNLSFTLDNAGDSDPWVEIYNAGAAPADLAGCFLSAEPTNLAQWAFPAGWTVPPGGFLLVWADGETNETTPAALHASFRLPPSTGCVTLAWQAADRLLALDALAYAGTPPNAACGSIPDGDSAARRVLHYPTPAATNRAASVPARVRINEWLADNTRTLADPADGKFQDWFELHAPAEEADLSGYWLTDDPAAPRQFAIPGGTRVPAGGFALFWADGEPSQNAPGRAVHVNFKLEKNGEALALYAPDGTLVDAVAFGPQQPDRSAGRWPDGAADIYPLSRPTPGASNLIFAATSLAPAGDANGAVRVDWFSDSGRLYRVAAADGLSNPAWTVIGVVTADGPTASFSDPAAALATQRFYRLSRQE